MENQLLFAGVDVGGTNIKVGIVDDSGQIIAQTKFPTEQQLGPQTALSRATSTITELVENAGRSMKEVGAVGLGTPGPMDIPDGMILTPTNLPAWRNFPVCDTLSEMTGLPVAFANDAAAASFGEYWIGTGRHAKSMILITLGTGVGGGIIVNDFSIDGSHSLGAEIGHMTVDFSESARLCSCGQRGHLEAYASATALVAIAEQQLAEGASSSLRDMISEASPLTALMISQAATAGDEFAHQLVMSTADWLARGIMILAHVIDPCMVLLGGAMNFGGDESPLGREFLDRIRVKIRNCTFPMIGDNLRIEFASLGSDAGYVGAAGLARRHYWTQQQRLTETSN